MTEYTHDVDFDALAKAAADFEHSSHAAMVAKREGNFERAYELAVEAGNKLFNLSLSLIPDDLVDDFRDKVTEEVGDLWADSTPSVDMLTEEQIMALLGIGPVKAGEEN